MSLSRRASTSTSPALVLTLTLVSLTLTLTLTAAKRYSPPPEIGMPAGLIPNCPGISKNASISARSLAALQVSLERLDGGGRLLSKGMPIALAHKLLAKERIDWSRPLVVHCGGWLDSAHWPHSRALARSYARRGYNVLLTETFTFLSHIYPKSVRLSRTIGRKLGEFLVRLLPLGASVERLELVGVSLGAHIAAFAARHVHAATGRKPRRLTGLDPAGPCFRAMPPDERFNDRDADFVDVVHTNIDGFGLAERLGHVDYYVNGGEWQPGDLPAVPCLVVCSHLRALLYWWQALDHPRQFIALRCHSVQDARLANCYNSTETNYMGLEARTERRGIFYLPTSNEFPYYRGRAGLRAENEIYTSVISSINKDDFEV